MSINRRKVLSVVGVFLIGAIVGGIAGAYISARVYSLMMLNNTIIGESADTFINLSVLRRIRNGEIDKATELLEINLDGKLIFLSANQKANKAVDQTTLKSLRYAAEYRTQYPRSNKDKEIDEVLNKVLSETTPIQK